MVTRTLRTMDYLKQLLESAKPFKLTLDSDGTELLECDPALTHKITVTTDACAKSKIRDSLIACVDRAGARVPYRCELYPSTRSQSSKNQELLGVMYSNLDKKYTNFPQFSEWFIKWVDGRSVAPDTGIILNHSLS